MFSDCAGFLLVYKECRIVSRNNYDVTFISTELFQKLRPRCLWKIHISETLTAAECMLQTFGCVHVADQRNARPFTRGPVRGPQKVNVVLLLYLTMQGVEKCVCVFVCGVCVCVCVGCECGVCVVCGVCGVWCVVCVCVSFN